MTPPLSIPVDAQLTGAGPADLAALARAAERAGFARLWAPELHRSSTIALAVAASATERIGIATGIALAFTRSPMTLALEALDLDELSGGRMVVGLGAGVRRLNADWHATPYDPPVARMRETVAALREITSALVEGRDARSPGDLVAVHVRGLRRGIAAPRTAIPVWLAAVLPGMTRLAGRVADGFLDHPVTSTAWLRDHLLPPLRDGAARAGRPVPEVAGALICAVDDDDPGRAVRAAAATVGFYATVRTYAGMFSEHGFADRLPAIRAAFLAGQGERMIDAVGPDMTAAFAAAGTRAEVVARARQHEGLCDRLWVTPPHHLQDAAAVRHWQDGILGAFGAP